MAIIVNLQPMDIELVGRVWNKYYDQLDSYNATDHYIVKYQFPEGKANIDITVLPNYYNFKVTPEASVLMMEKSGIPSFEIGLASDRQGKVKIFNPPYSKDARKFLDTRFLQRDNRWRLIQIATICTALLSCLSFAMDVREFGNNTIYTPRKDFEEFVDAYFRVELIEKRRKNLLDGWDVVTLTENQYYKVIDTNSKNGHEYSLENIPLPRFCLAIYDGKQTDYYFYEQKGKTIRCGVCDPENYVTKFFDVNITGKTEEGIASTLHVDDKEKGLWEWLNEPCGENGEGNWEWCADAFFIINTFMLYYGDVTFDVETKEAIAPSGSRSQKRHDRKNTVRLFKTYKLVKNWKSQARKKAEYTCPCWGVRGHFRHYKNGKVIFIEPHLKGKDKDQYKGKEYALMPYKDA